MNRLSMCSMVLVLLGTAWLRAADEKEKPKQNQNNKPKIARKKIKVQVIPVRPGQALPVRILPASRFYGVNRLNLVRRPDVQKELQLDEDQKKEITDAIQELNKKRRDEFTKLRNLQAQDRAKKYAELNKKLTDEANKKVGEILKPAQVRRLDEIAIQLQGLRALQDPAVVKKLSITEEQQKKIAAVQTDGQKKLRKLFQDIRAGNLDRGKLAEKRAEIQKETEKKTLEVLTKEQRAHFEKMKGKKFELQNRGRVIRAVPGKIRINGRKIQRKIQIRKIRVQPKPINPQKADKKNPQKDG